MKVGGLSTESAGLVSEAAGARSARRLLLAQHLEAGASSSLRRCCCGREEPAMPGRRCSADGERQALEGEDRQARIRIISSHLPRLLQIECEWAALSVCGTDFC